MTVPHQQRIICVGRGYSTYRREDRHVCARSFATDAKLLYVLFLNVQKSFDNTTQVILQLGSKMVKVET